MLPILINFTDQEMADLLSIMGNTSMPEQVYLEYRLMKEWFKSTKWQGVGREDKK